MMLSGSAKRGSSPILTSLPMPQPSRDDFMNASAVRVKQLCAEFADDISRLDQHRRLSLFSINLPPADLTLPPLTNGTGKLHGNGRSLQDGRVGLTDD